MEWPEEKTAREMQEAIAAKGEKKLTFWDILRTPFMKFAEAVKTDKTLESMAVDPKNSLKKNQFKLQWLREYWYIPFIGLILFFVAFGNVKPPRVNKRRTHHGINQYGESY